MKDQDVDEAHGKSGGVYSIYEVQRSDKFGHQQMVPAGGSECSLAGQVGDTDERSKLTQSNECAEHYDRQTAGSSK